MESQCYLHLEFGIAGSPNNIVSDKMRIQIETKLPEYCRTTKNPRFKIVQVRTPDKWLPTYEEIAAIIKALSECEKENRMNGQKQYNRNEILGTTSLE